MYDRSPFLVRRVLAGVFVGAAVLALAFFGWARYRTAQYHDRESRVVAQYRSAYDTCVSTQGQGAACGDRVGRACAADRFWSEPAPFTFGLGGSIDDASIRCVFAGPS